MYSSYFGKNKYFIKKWKGMGEGGTKGEEERRKSSYGKLLHCADSECNLAG